MTTTMLRIKMMMIKIERDLPMQTKIKRLTNLLAIGMRTSPYWASVAASYIVTGTTVMF